MKSLVLWITGLPGCGKSTVADSVKQRYPDFVVLRVDELRRVVTPAPTYSEEERDTVYRCLVYAAQVVSGLGHPVIIDATGNRRRWRDLARALMPSFAEVYLKCPVSVCMERERTRADTHGAPRDIFRKGAEGWPVPGLSAPYEEPLDPELTIETGRVPPEEAAALIHEFIERRTL